MPFLAESIETLLRSLCAKFTWKDLVERTKTASLLIKLDVTDKTNQRDIKSVDLAFGVKYELKRLTDSKKATSMRVFQFKKEAMKFLASLCSQAMEKKSTSIILCKVPEMFVS